MKQNNTQQGSAHVVIIVLLVIALLGALGFVFYQNFIAKKPESSQQNTPVVVEEEKNKTVAEQIALNSNIYEIDRPTTWTATKEQDEPSSKTITLIDPGKDIEVTFTASEGGIGGLCDTTSPNKVRFYNVYPTALTQLGVDKAHLIEAIFDADGGGYQYIIGLTRDGGATHAAVGDSYCTVAFAGITTSVIGGSEPPAVIVSSIKFPKITTDGNKVKEMQPVKDILQTDSYKEAVAILESARKK